MSDFTVTGADDFYRLSKALKAAGRTELRKELNKAMRDAAKPLVAKAREAAVAELPSRGGLGRFIARKRTSIQTRTGRDPGVAVKINKQDPRLDTQGRLSHPVFGRRPNVVQTVRSGVFSRALEASAPPIRQDLEQALQDMADRIVREVG